MFERYTDRARRVIFFARYDASALASSSIDTEHLLLGLLREGTGIAGKIFKRNKLTYEVVRREIEARGRLHLLLGLLRESECLAADILTSKGLHLEEVREETRLQSPTKEVAPRPKEAFPKLVDFLRQLEDRRAAYHVSGFHQEAIRVEVALPEDKWVVTFFPEGRVAVEVFSASGAVEDESALARLLGRLGPPKNG
jgi:ATP-dependent Clp protease ATP-binding subunit ClpA